MAEKYTINIQGDECTCECHQNPYIKHIMPCCDGKKPVRWHTCEIYEWDVCSKCKHLTEHADRKIYHSNNHVWPGFAGEPDGGDYGGSDF